MVTAGHSEGAVVVTQLARRREDLQGIILLSGPAKPLLALMIWQQYETQQRTEGPDAARTAEYEQALAWTRDYAAWRPVPEDRPANRFGRPFGAASQACRSRRSCNKRQKGNDGHQGTIR